MYLRFWSRMILRFWLVVRRPLLFWRSITLRLRWSISWWSSISSTAGEEESFLDHLEECWSAGCWSAPDASRLPSPSWPSSLTRFDLIFIIIGSFVFIKLLHQLVDIHLRHSSFSELLEGCNILVGVLLCLDESHEDSKQSHNKLEGKKWRHVNLGDVDSIVQSHHIWWKGCKEILLRMMRHYHYYQANNITINIEDFSRKHNLGSVYM